MKVDLIQLIKEVILTEITAYKKHGLTLPSSLEQLKKYINMDGVYINLVNMPKIGINPQYEHGNIVGVYGYPLTTETIIQYLGGDLAVGTGRKFINIFRYQSESDSDTINTERYDNNRLNLDIEKLKQIYGEENVSHGINANKEVWSYREKPVKKLLEIIKEMPGSNSNKLHSALLRLGYSALIDNSGIYMTDTRNQIVVFNPRRVELLERINNPLNKDKKDILKGVEAHQGKATPEVEALIRRQMYLYSIEELMSLIRMFKDDRNAFSLIGDIGRYIFDKFKLNPEQLKQLMDSGISLIQELVLSQKNIPYELVLAAAGSKNPYLLEKVIYKLNFEDALRVMKENKYTMKNSETIDAFVVKIKRNKDLLNNLSPEDLVFVKGLIEKSEYADELRN